LRTKKTRGPKEPKSKKKGTGTAVGGSSYAQQVAYDVVPRFDPVHEVHRDAELRRVALHFLFFFWGSFFGSLFFSVSFGAFLLFALCSFFCSFFLVVLFARFAFSGCFARFEKKKK
jgi:hypothetical protein